MKYPTQSIININSIKQIVIIFNENGYDLEIDQKDISRFSINQYEEKENRRIKYKNIEIEFELNNFTNDYSLQALISKDYLIEGILIKYSDKPSLIFKKYNDELISDMEIKYINKAKNLKVQLTINSLFICDISKYKKSEVKIYDINNINDYSKYRIMGNLNSGAIIYLNDKNIPFEIIDLRLLDSSYIIKSKRVELYHVNDNWVAKENNNDYLEQIFSNKVDDYNQYLQKVNKAVIDSIKTKTANHGFNGVYIHHYKYRINEEVGLFNILVEWSYLIK